MGASVEDIAVTVSTSGNLCDRMVVIRRVTVRVTASIFGVLSVSSTVLNILRALICIILKATLWRTYYLYSRMVVIEGSEAQRVH